MAETARARLALDAALADYRFNDAANGLYAFVWGKVCDWYVEFAKPLFADDATAAETRAVMAWVLDQCMVLMHPVMPFVTEELWQITGTRAKPLVHADWPTYGEDLVDPEAMSEMTWVIALIDGVRSARAQMRVPVGLYLPVVQVDLDDRGRAAWTRGETLIRRLARLGDLTEGAAPRGSVTVPVEGGLFALPLEGVIDIAAERARLEKTLAKLEGDLKGLSARLNNPKFVASAPEEVVAETRDAQASTVQEADKLRDALARLATAG
jgi:valyl-tRNA synthetase